eukprot:comp12577_c0_seq1/m.7582 comp12577_c0_seq1/g.7582  ORF comp12577_c0_seq1/g.7582 comp12577_c0_seq1/m.7582 type:complete len:144 (-) comp12577_c0_seq1:560-991(-)
MGWLTHAFEAEYHFDASVPLEDLKKAVEQALDSLSSRRYYRAPKGDELFRRGGAENSLDNAYKNKTRKNEELTVFGTHTTKMLKFVDDMAFTFGESNGRHFIKVFSVSRQGMGDLYQNKRNAEGVMTVVSRTYQPRDKVIIRS